MTQYTLVYNLSVVDADGVEVVASKVEFANTEDAYAKALRNIPRRKGYVANSLEVTEEVMPDMAVVEINDAAIVYDTYQVPMIADAPEPVVEVVAEAVPAPTEVIAPVAKGKMIETEDGVMVDYNLWIPARRAAEFMQVKAPHLYNRIYRGRMQTVTIIGVMHVLKSEMIEWKMLRAEKNK